MSYLAKKVQFVDMSNAYRCCIYTIFYYMYRKYLIYNQLFEYRGLYKDFVTIY